MKDIHLVDMQATTNFDQNCHQRLTSRAGQQ